MTFNSTIDLSQLPAPLLVEELNFEATYDDLVAKFTELWAAKRAANPALPAINVLNLETDPLATAFQVFAYEVVRLRARINDAGKSNLVAFATGADLEHLAANFGVTRLTISEATETEAAVLETDDRLRRRILLKAESYSVAGPAGAYVYHALTADPTIRDATAVQGTPGRVVVTVMAASDEPTPSTEQLQTIMRALSADTVRPLTDMVTVQPPAVTEVEITAALTIFPGPDGSIVQQNAINTLTAWLAENAYLGRDLRRSALFSRLHVDGVLSVSLSSPASDVVVGPTEAVKVTAINITIAGVDT